MSRGRRTQVAKGAVCKTAIQRFDPARRLHFPCIPWKARAGGKTVVAEELSVAVLFARGTFR